MYLFELNTDFIRILKERIFSQDWEIFSTEIFQHDRKFVIFSK